jgi:HlyD family secretion protein
MQILASVDESDIGRISDGQAVTFTVQSYPDETFEGTVRQVRLQSVTTENVVNYTVVVSVANPDGRLLPGMTATVTFHTASATDVLTVPNAALRFRPSSVSGDGAAQGRSANAGTRAQWRAGGALRDADAASSADTTTSTARFRPDATLWSVDATGKLVPVPVHSGLSDGQKTQVQGPGLRDGMQVIVGSNGTGSDALGASSTRNPLQAQQQGGRPRPAGMF